jgi:hypothetical protein
MCSISPVPKEGEEKMDLLDGLHVKHPDRPEVYLMERGERRHIPVEETYESLFCDDDRVCVDSRFEEVPFGVPLSPGAVLAKAWDAEAVYLISNGQKRWVSEATMERYGFSGDNIHEVAPILLQSIPDGPDMV